MLLRFRATLTSATLLFLNRAGGGSLPPPPDIPDTPDDNTDKQLSFRGQTLMFRGEPLTWR